MNRAAVLVVLCMWMVMGSPLGDRVWPTTGLSAVRNLQSSPFGPRQLFSGNFRYDYHRGLDIPLPMCSPLYAIDDGVVTISYDHPKYQDPVLQFKITSWGSEVYYANYLHINASYVSVGENVTKGQLIGCSGASIASGTGFEHLHFEIRKGSMKSRACEVPFLYLPYDDTANNLIVGVEEVVRAGDMVNVTIHVSQPKSELDLVEFGIYIQGNDGNTAEQSFNLNERNRANTGPPENMDNPQQGNVGLYATRFNANYDVANYTIVFSNVAINGGDMVVGYALDARGNRVVSTKMAVEDVNSSATLRGFVRLLF